MSIAIDVRNLKKSFSGKPAVVDVSLQVHQGEIFGFLGPNGSGKTTTIRMICGLLLPDAGNGTCLGFDILKQPQEIKSHAGYMIQSFSLYEDLSIKENLEFFARLYRVANRQQAVMQALNDLGLYARRDQLTGTLSGGWKQRLSLSAALLHSPRLLLLDEPTAGVDPRARREFWDHIHDLAAQGITVLVTTHYMDEAERCHRLAYILDGKIIVQGTKDEIINSSRLTTWQVTGADVTGLATQLKNLPGVDQVAAFGNSLHVSGRDATILQTAVSGFQSAPYQWQQIPPSLEDIFILEARQ